MSRAGALAHLPQSGARSAASAWQFSAVLGAGAGGRCERRIRVLLPRSIRPLPQRGAGRQQQHLEQQHQRSAGAPTPPAPVPVPLTRPPSPLPQTHERVSGARSQLSCDSCTPRTQQDHCPIILKVVRIQPTWRASCLETSARSLVRSMLQASTRDAPIAGTAGGSRRYWCGVRGREGGFED